MPVAPVAVLPFRLTPAVGLAAYAIGDQVSTLQTLRGATYATPDRAATLENLTIINFSNNALQLRLHMFAESVTLAADNAPFDASLADVRNYYLGYFETAQSDFVDVRFGGATRKIATYSGVALDVFSQSLNNLQQRTDSIFLALETRRAETFTSVDALLLLLNFRT